MNKYQHVIAEFYNTPWAILPSKLTAIDHFIRLSASGEKVSAEEVRTILEAGARQSKSAPGNVALIPIYGTISKRANLMSQFSGGTSTEKLTTSFRTAMADPSVKAIVFDVDSPGGSVDGVPELAAEIAAARGVKKTIAVSNTMAASAAYWLASAADELVVTPSGAVGSIGVFAAHEDVSKALEAEGVTVSLVSAGKYKVEGNPYEPLSGDARAALQSQVDEFYGMFVKAVASNRGATQSAVREGYGEGRMVLASQAVKEGMADRVETLDQTLSRLGVSAPSAKPAAVHTNAQRERELALYQ